MSLSSKINQITLVVKNVIQQSVEILLQKNVVIENPDKVKLTDIPGYISTIIVSNDEFPFRFNFYIDAIKNLATPQTGKESSGLNTFASFRLANIPLISFNNQPDISITASGLSYGIPYQTINTSVNTDITIINPLTFNFSNPITSIVYTDQGE